MVMPASASVMYSLLVTGKNCPQTKTARSGLGVNLRKWVSLSFPQFGEIGGNAGFDDGVVGGRSDGRRLLDEAVEQESTGL